MGSRPLYRHADLRRLVDPASIAIVGASAREGSFGLRLLRNLSRYKGRLHLVNARYERIEERPCHPSLSALPEVPDCVVVAAPREQVEAVVDECARLGVGGVIVFASGFAETGKPERAAEQARIVEAARRGGVRMVGPNCLGVVNYASGAIVSFAASAVIDAPRPLSVGLASQSGALGFALAQAIEHGVSFSHVLTAGNSADVDVADYVAYLAEDDACKAIACVFEGMADPMRLIEAAQLARSRGKPVIVFKIATGEQGAAAALSHTGSLAGSHQTYRAAFERAGIVLVDDFAALVETASFFAKASKPLAAGVAVASTSGGAAIMAADEGELRGVELPQPGEATRAVLVDAIPEFGSARNPCDVTAQVISDPASFRKVAEALLSDPAYGTLVVPFGYAYDTATPRIGVLDALAREQGKIACIAWLTQWLEGPGATIAEQSERVAVFRSMGSCFDALAKWHWWWRQAEAGREAPAPLVPDEVVRSVGESIDATQAAVLTESRAKAALAAYGIPMVQDRLVASADEAAAAAREAGFPVVLKVESVDIPHKTEAGVVRLGLQSEEAVRAAHAEIMANALKLTHAGAIRGVLVQPMVGAGVEVFVGARIDPQFGPTVVAGLGGIMVELMRDSAVALAPLGRQEALDMLCGLKGAPLLQGFRGSEPVDLERLADIVCRVGQFASDHRDRITELDLNPLICSGSRIVGVDALIGLRSPTSR
ncbi:acetate--CoA ligase family protein [Burkholderiaceae bacterium FT117]|uniref:acetate--CoA ligase family protein n=1 Tax=Zeimonas sediminis TaxID=2944268 RepID=UPI0023431253|nr:acetate--CoA ligase family protein [Zeimonas sediminis]MCM5570503.1 acetate--CoA ligase family protein [Zeimonas sediminis]